MKKYKLIKTLAIATPVLLTPLIANSCGKKSSNPTPKPSQNPNDVFAVKELNAALKQQFGSTEFEKIVSETRENNNAGASSYTEDISYFIKEIYKNAIDSANASTDKPKGFNSDIINNIKITAGASGAVNIKHSEDTAGPSGKWEIIAYPTFIASSYPKSSGTLYYNMVIDKYALNNQSFDFALRPGFRFISRASESLDLGDITQISTGDNGNIIAISSRSKAAVGIWNAKRGDYDYNIVDDHEGSNNWTACKVLNKNSVIFGNYFGQLALGTYDVQRSRFTFKYVDLPDLPSIRIINQVRNFSINKADPSEFFISATYAGLYKYSVTDAGAYKFESHYAISHFYDKIVTCAAGTVDNGKYLYVGTGRTNLKYKDGGVYMLNLTSPANKAQLFDWSAQEGAAGVSQFDRIASMDLDAKGNLIIGFNQYNIDGDSVYNNRGILFGYRTGNDYGVTSYKWTSNTLNNSYVTAIATFAYSDQSEKLVLASGDKIFYSTINTEQETTGTFTQYTTSGTYNDLVADGDNPHVYSLDFFKTGNNYYLYAGSEDGLFISRTYNRS